MLPYFKDLSKNHLERIEKNYCKNIAAFFKEMERKLTTKKYKFLDYDNVPFEGNNISRLMGKPKSKL